MTLLAGLMPIASASTQPATPDLVVSATAEPMEVVHTGGWSTLTIDVRNAGTAGTIDIALAIQMPEGTWIFSDGFVIAEGWQCDLQTTATCTHGPLAAGISAEPLHIPFGISPGTAGDALTVRATAVTVGHEIATANNTGQATVRYVQGTVDLEFTAGSEERELINGEVTGIVTRVRNAGTSPSGEVTVTVPLPAGMTYYGETADGWKCAFGEGVAGGQTGWRCTHEPVRADETSAMIGFYVTISGANPGDILTLTATAATNSTETTLDDNTVHTRVTVLQAATVRGTVWVDSDRDGARDADEPGAPPGSEGVDHVVVDAQADGQPGVLATVNPDGTYVAQVRPGTYRVEFYVRDPYSFTDSADSDLVYYDNCCSYTRYGYSAWLAVAGGEEAVVDAAVVSKYLTPSQ